jgi:hypothetical protein
MLKTAITDIASRLTNALMFSFPIVATMLYLKNAIDSNVIGTFKPVTVFSPWIWDFLIVYVVCFITPITLLNLWAFSLDFFNEFMRRLSEQQRRLSETD